MLEVGGFALGRLDLGGLDEPAVGGGGGGRVLRGAADLAGRAGVELGGERGSHPGEPAAEQLHVALAGADGRLARVEQSGAGGVELGRQVVALGGGARALGGLGGGGPQPFEACGGLARFGKVAFEGRPAGLGGFELLGQPGGAGALLGGLLLECRDALL